MIKGIYNKQIKKGQDEKEKWNLRITGVEVMDATQSCRRRRHKRTGAYGGVQEDQVVTTF